MVRTYLSFPIADFTATKLRMLNWANRFNICCFLDNNNYLFQLHSRECLLAVGEIASTANYSGSSLHKLEQLLRSHNDWVFGHLSYDLKAEIHNLPASHAERFDFPNLYFFVPDIILNLEADQLTIGCFTGKQEEIFESINNTILSESLPADHINISPRVPGHEYLEIVQKLRQHILRGDCYEINYCQEFYAENCSVDPLGIYQKLSRISPNPFSAFYKFRNQYLICASPERYLKKSGEYIYSQPIKGTASRDLRDALSDHHKKESLYTSAKDRSENVMVVDLVRNDLSRVCTEGSVRVEELFGIYSFPQVHQMISTISGILHKEVTIPEIIEATFPMGSMTGAPKRRVMELIEKYEVFRRGLFSGAVGYISPEKDMDLNVVIRSMLYNSVTKYLSFSVGSGITWYSDPVQEYQECLLKAEAMMQVIQQS